MNLLGLFLMLGPYLLLYAAKDPGGERWQVAVASASSVSIILTQIAMLILGASIIGSERQSRGLEFLLGLPPSRSRILLAKALFCMTVAVTLFGGSLLMTEVITGVPPAAGEIRQFGCGAMLVGLTLFAVAWLASVFIRGIAIPAIVSLSVFVVLLTLIVRFAAAQDWALEEYSYRFQLIMYPGFASLAIGSFVGGWVAFVRRREP